MGGINLYLGEVCEIGLENALTRRVDSVGAIQHGEIDGAGVSGNTKGSSHVSC